MSQIETITIPISFNCGYCNCSEFGNLKESPERTVRQYEVELFFEDGKETYLNGRRIPVQKDHIIVARPGDRRHSLLPFKTLYIKFSADGLLAEMLEDLPPYFFSLHAKQLRELMHEIIVLNESKEPDECLLAGRLMILLSHLRKDAAHSSRGTNCQFQAMHTAKKYIDTHYDEKFNTAAIAAMVNLSDSRFRFLFKTAYGVSPHQYAMNVRISVAKQLLWNTDIPMTAIAERCGFGCQQYFNDIFKRETGTTPGRYRSEFSRKYEL